MTSSDWSQDALLIKAQIYSERALQSDRNSSLFPFWASLTLELIGRATLSSIHPVLIADPREGNNILHAFGFPSKKGNAKTIGAKTVFVRLKTIVPDFNEAEDKFCQSFINMRNEELHSGTPIFEDLSTNSWLTSFYHSCKILLEFQERSLQDLFGSEEAEVAEHMIVEGMKELESQIKKRISDYRTNFGKLTSKIRQDRIDTSHQKIEEFIRIEDIRSNHKIELCPSCKNEALLIGRYISESEPKVVDDEILIHHNLLPIEFRCFCCNLKLEGNGELIIADLGGQFAIENYSDPMDYYLHNLEPDFDYGND